MRLKEFISRSLIEIKESYSGNNPIEVEFEIWVLPERRMKIADNKQEWWTDIVVVNELPNASRLKFKLII